MADFRDIEAFVDFEDRFVIQRTGSETEWIAAKRPIEIRD